VISNILQAYVIVLAPIAIGFFVRKEKKNSSEISHSHRPTTTSWPVGKGKLKKFSISFLMSAR
jgi:hypothetical protein